MNRFEQIFSRPRKALVIFDSCGCPNLEESEKRIEEIVNSGAEFIFSDRSRISGERIIIQRDSQEKNNSVKDNLIAHCDNCACFRRVFKSLSRILCNELFFFGFYINLGQYRSFEMIVYNEVQIINIYSSAVQNIP